MSYQLDQVLSSFIPPSHFNAVKELFDSFPNYEQNDNDQVLLWNAFVDTVFEAYPLKVSAKRKLYDLIYKTRKAESGPPIIWTPKKSTIEKANITSLMNELMIKDYRSLHRWTVENREEFWRITLKRLGIKFDRDPERVLSYSDRSGIHVDSENTDRVQDNISNYTIESPGWLRNSLFNIVDSCFTSHPSHNAIVYRSEENPDMMTFVTYGELESLVNRIANGLFENGFVVGDHIAIDMPMTVCILFGAFIDIFTNL